MRLGLFRIHMSLRSISHSKGNLRSLPPTRLVKGSGAVHKSVVLLVERALKQHCTSGVLVILISKATGGAVAIWPIRGTKGRALLFSSFHLASLGV